MNFVDHVYLKSIFHTYITSITKFILIIILAYNIIISFESINNKINAYKLLSIRMNMFHIILIDNPKC